MDPAKTKATLESRAPRLHALAALLVLAGCHGGSALRELRATDAVVETRGYRIVLPYADDELSRQVARIVESTLDVSAELFSVAPLARRDEPWTVYLYSTVAEYEQYERKLTGGKFATNQAFSHAATHSAHLVLLPEVPPEAGARLGLPFHTQRNLAHELAHLFVFPHLGGESLPTWLSEGAATWVEAEAMLAVGEFERLEAEPWSATHFARAQDLAASGELPRLRSLVNSEPNDLPPSSVYALRYLLFRFLKERHAAQLDQLLGLAFQPESGRYVANHVQAGALSILGAGAGWKALDAEFESFIAGFEPEWFERSRSLHTGAGDWTQAPVGESTAVAWRRESLAAGAVRLSGAVELFPRTEGKAHLYFEQSDGRSHLFEFRSTGGLLYYRKSVPIEAPGEWQLAGKLPPSAGAARDSAQGFLIEFTDGACRIGLDDEPPVDLPTDARLESGRWGLGVVRGSTAVWSDVEFSQSGR